MQQDKDRRLPPKNPGHTVMPTRCYPTQSKSTITPNKYRVRFQNQNLRIHNSRTNLPKACQEAPTSASITNNELFPNSREENSKKHKTTSKINLGKEVKVISNPKFITMDCWNSEEIPAKLVQLYNENEREDDQIEGNTRKRKLGLDDIPKDPVEKLSYTKEFHVLTEVQKARILTAVEDTIKKLANKDYFQEDQSRAQDTRSFHSQGVLIDKYLCKKFLLPWVIMKVMEMIVCHIIQLTFLSNDTYFFRKNEFLPVVVTYYFTLFIIIFSLVMHIVCYSYGEIQNPCYFMCIISSSILTMTTALGVMIMLCSMDYYRTFREILVLVFTAVLLCSHIAELCICYVEVKNFWNRMQTTEQYYIS